MPITKNRELESINYHVSRGAVDVAWKDQIIEDGNVIHEAVHRGAFPVDANGDLTPADEAKLGQKLTALLSQAGAKAVKQIDKVKEKVTKLETDLGSERETKAEIRAERDQLSAERDELSAELVRAVGLVTQLQQDLSAAREQIDSLQAQLAAVSPPIE